VGEGLGERGKYLVRMINLTLEEATHCYRRLGGEIASNLYKAGLPSVAIAFCQKSRILTDSQGY